MQKEADDKYNKALFDQQNMNKQKSKNRKFSKNTCPAEYSPFKAISSGR